MRPPDGGFLPLSHRTHPGAPPPSLIRRRRPFFPSSPRGGTRFSPYWTLEPDASVLPPDEHGKQRKSSLLDEKKSLSVQNPGPPFFLCFPHLIPIIELASHRSSFLLPPPPPLESKAMVGPLLSVSVGRARRTPFSSPPFFLFFSTAVDRAMQLTIPGPLISREMAAFPFSFFFHSRSAYMRREPKPSPFNKWKNPAAGFSPPPPFFCRRGGGASPFLTEANRVPFSFHFTWR